MNQIAKSYSDVLDEYYSFMSNAGAQSPKFKDVSEYAQFMDKREGGEFRKSAYDPNFLQKAYDFLTTERLPLGQIDSPFKQKIADLYAGAHGQTAGPVTNQAVQGVTEPLVGPDWAQTIGGAAEGVVETVPDIALMAAGGTPGLVAAGANAALRGYAPHKDPIAAAVGPATLVTGVKALPVVSKAFGSVAADVVTPSVQKIVNASSPEFGSVVADALAPSAAKGALVKGAEVAGNLTGGTVLGEGARMASQALHGEKVEFADPHSLAASAIQGLAFLPMDVASEKPGRQTVSERASAKITQAEGERARIASEVDQLGSRTVALHKDILSRAARGEAVEGPLSELGKVGASRRAFAESLGVEQAKETVANMSKDLSDNGLADLLQLVTGRFDSRAESGGVSGEAFQDMIRVGSLPKLSYELVNKFTKIAEKQGLGNDLATRSFLAEQIHAYYEEQIQQAYELYKQQKQPLELSKGTSDVIEEGAREEKSLRALTSLLAQAPQSVKDALIKRHIDLVTLLHGPNMAVDAKNQGRYRNWQDALVEIAQTYDPVTKSGQVSFSKVPVTLEMLASPEGLRLPARRMLNTSFSQESGKGTPYDTLVNEWNRRASEDFGDENQATQVLQDQENAAKMKSARRAQEDVTDPLTKEAGEVSKMGDIEDVIDTNVPEEGVELPAVYNPKSEASTMGALQLVKTLQEMPELDINRRVASVMGTDWLARGGKAAILRDALLSRIEWDALKPEVGRRDTLQQITPTMVKFYDSWKSPEKPGLATMPVAEAAAQFRHAQRLYWAERSASGFQLEGVVKAVLGEKAQYAKMMQGNVQKQTAGATFVDPAGVKTQAWTTGNAKQDAMQLFYGFARRLGYDQSAAEQYAQLAGKMQTLFPENQAVGRLVGDNSLGVNMPYPTGQPLVGLNVHKIAQEAPGKVEATTRLMQTFAHELAHNYSFQPKEGPTLSSVYLRQRADAYHTLRAMFENMGPQAADDFLNQVVKQAFVPPQHLGVKDSWLTYPGADFQNEAISRLMEYVMLGAASRGNPALMGARTSAATAGELFAWMPKDVQAFTQFAYRDFANMVYGLQDLYAKRPDLPGAEYLEKYVAPIAKYAENFLAANTQKMIEAEAVTKQLFTQMRANGALAGQSDPIIVRTPIEMDRAMLEGLARTNKVSLNVGKPEDFEPTQGELFGTSVKKQTEFQTEDQRRLGVRLSLWDRTMKQLYQVLNQYDKAGIGQPVRDFTYTINDLEKSYWRLTQSAFQDQLGVGKDGNFKLDPESPVQRLKRGEFKDSKAGHDALRELYLWSQKAGTPVIVEGQVSPDAQAKVTEALKGLRPETQQAVLESLDKLVKVQQRVSDMTYAAELERTATKVAQFWMTRDKGMFHADAFTRAKQAVVGILDVEKATLAVEVAREKAEKLTANAKTNPALLQDPNVQQAQAELQSAVQVLNQTRAGYAELTKTLTPDQHAVLQNYMAGPTGVARDLVKLQGMMEKRRDWFMTEQRPGRYQIFGQTPDGESYAVSEPSEHAAKARAKELAGKGYGELRIVDRVAEQQSRKFAMPDEFVNDFVKLEAQKFERFLETVKGNLTEAEFAELKQASTMYVPGEATTKYLQKKGLERNLIERGFVAGRETLNPFEVMDDYVRRTVGTIARRGVRGQVDLILKDPRLRQHGQFRDVAEKAMATLMEPVGDEYTKVRTAIVGYYLGLPNVVSPLVESSQILGTVFPELVRVSNDFSGSVKKFLSAPVKIAQFADAWKTFEGKRLLASAEKKMYAQPDAMTLDEALAYGYRKATLEGSFQHGVAQRAMGDADQAALRQYSTGMGLRDAGNLMSDALYHLATKSMGLYNKVSSYNNKIAYMTALEHYYETGLRGRELFDAADVFKNRATFGGGKPNEVGYVNYISNPNIRSALSLVQTLQRYQYGMVGQWKGYVDDVVSSLPARERAGAAKALTTAFATQVALSGAMGIPGAALMAGVLQQYGIDVKQKSREFFYDLAKRLTDNDPLAVMLTNTAQNGYMSQLTGADLSSRVSLNSFLGFDSFEGYDVTNLLGPGGGLVQNLFNATKLAAEGQQVKAVQRALPPSLAPVPDIVKQTKEFGQVGLRTKDGKLIKNLTTPEVVGYALGTRPSWYRQYRDQQQALKIASDGYEQVKDQRVDEAASALRKGDARSAFEMAREFAKANPGADPKTALRSVVDRSLAQTNAQDLLAQVPTGMGQRAQEIAKTFGDVGRQSEVNLLIQRERLNALTGYAAGDPASSDAITRAALIDALVKSRGITREQAVKLAGLMGF